jgi:hypothetical protein
MDNRDLLTIFPRLVQVPGSDGNSNNKGFKNNDMLYKRLIETTERTSSNGQT